MRYATVTLTWTDLSVLPLDDAFASSDAMSVEAIRYVSPIRDEAYAELLELRGDLEEARRLLADDEDAIAYDVAGDGERGVAYVQCRTAAVAGELLSILHEHEIVVDWPLSVIDPPSGRGFELTVIGTSRAIQRAAADLPEGFRLDLERTGEYDPGTGRLSSVLTDRQLELFELAVAEGYYEVPRETTHRELAADLDLSPATVSEHLQRVESKLVSTYVDGP
ncbi:helix-turn-helix domain-containing protein [Halorussus marinus]|uniref:helix-turn-helix domain-containing protein n=1 Tax=Halorussus marinus TaxID=2505976 RepID=UPI00106E3A30|nr:helix-turn-helix domain-containing protein [Halorussus marinus]